VVFNIFSRFNCKSFTAIAPRLALSWRDSCDLGEISKYRAEIIRLRLAISPPKPVLGEITTISARFRNIASRYLPRGEIMTRSRRGKPVLGKITAISARFQNIAPRYLARSEIATRSRHGKLVRAEIHSNFQRVILTPVVEFN